MCGRKILLFNQRGQMINQKRYAPNPTMPKVRFAILTAPWAWKYTLRPLTPRSDVSPTVKHKTAVSHPDCAFIQT